MYDEPEPMRQIHEIRARIAKESEGLTVHEFCDLIHERTRGIREEIYGKQEKSDGNNSTEVIDDV